MNKDLTVGSPSKVLWQFCLPMFGSIIFQQLYNIADSLVAGKFIGEKIYLGVEQGLEPDSTAVIMELELTPHSKAGIRTEQDNTSAGVQWKMNY